MTSGFNHPNHPYYYYTNPYLPATQRVRSQTDSVLHAFSTSLEASSGLATENAAALEAHKSRLYELFALIEKEFDALHSENSALRSRLEGQGHSIQHHFASSHLSNHQQIEKNVVAANDPSNYAASSPMPVSEANSMFSSGANTEQTDKLNSKKPTQAARQKWKGRLVTSLKSGGGGNLLADTSKHRFVQNFKGHSDGIWHVDAACLGVASMVVGSASADQTAKLWSAEDGKCLLNYTGHTGSRGSLGHIWKANLGSSLNSSTVGNHMVSEANEYDSMFSDRIAITETKGQEECSDLDQSIGRGAHLQQPLIRLTGHTDVVVSGEWLYGGDQVITASWDRTANVYDAETGKIVNVLSGHDQELTHCNAHNSQKLVATASKDFTFRLWDFREPIQSVAVFQGHNDAVTSVVFTQMHHILSGSDDRTAKVWDLRNMRSPISAIRLNSPANRISVCSKYNLIAIPQDGRHISIYDLQGMRISRLPITNGKCHHRMVCSTKWLSDHTVNNLISSGFDRQIIGWKVQIPVSKG
uniref:WD repeat-containing protein 37 n=1 Tax=Ditylenchus dipsaci TaxID=166011 RepID=A0A915CZN6_9BILA